MTPNVIRWNDCPSVRPPEKTLFTTWGSPESDLELEPGTWVRGLLSRMSGPIIYACRINTTHTEGSLGVLPLVPECCVIFLIVVSICVLYSIQLVSCRVSLSPYCATLVRKCISWVKFVERSY